MRLTVTGRAPTPAELQDARRLADLARETLPRVRAAAENWRNAMLGAVGIVVAVTVLKGPASLSTASGGWQTGTLTLVAGAVSAAVVSLALAMLASFGWPSPERLTSATRLTEWETAEARRTVSRLRWSMATALAFVTLFVTGLGVSALAPTAKPQVEVIRTDGTVACGDRLSVTATGVTVRARDSDIAVPAAQIAAVRPVAACTPP